jgi:hypothetical protein
VNNDIRLLGQRKWKNMILEREEWKNLLKKTRAHIDNDDDDDDGW